MYIMSNLSNGELLKLKKMSTDLLAKKLREDGFSLDERIEAIHLLRLRGKDTSEFENTNNLKEAKKSGRPKRSSKKKVKIIGEDILSMNGEELENAIIETGSNSKCRAMIEYFDIISPESAGEIDLSKLDEHDLSILREILVGISELLPKEKVLREKTIKEKVVTTPNKKKEKKILEEEGQNATNERVKIKRSKRDLPRPGTKAEKIYLELSTTTNSLYRIALDNDTYFSVIRGILERYDIVRPKESYIIPKVKVDRRGLDEKGSSDFLKDISND